MTLAATFHSPTYSPPNYDFDTIEVFDSLEDVIDALFDRYAANGQREITSAYLDGHTATTLWPNVEPGAYFNCYWFRNAEDDDLLTHEEKIDAAEGARLEVHTAVHGGWKDYTVTLVVSEQGALVCQVEKAGI